ncbi:MULTISPECIES: ABC transporter permease [Novosphingobium]|jgi:peptide/nickel transport system permease protein|uniref:ABC transporter permease n=1 Tax=Novosphingobium TaxID=165696 RepID=UPI0022F29268|nr:ABC transporter permease [Novosphingobium resinovorum]GLK44897.1 peptide ABC transporter permease [Novosphingobium resinovorum]
MATIYSEQKPPAASPPWADENAADEGARSERTRLRLPAWLPWLGGRVLSGLATAFVISILVFAATQALPSDPARVILGPDATEASIRTLQAQLGLDQPILVQYAKWAGRALTGEFGVSLDSSVPAGQIVADRFGNSAALMAVVLAIAVPLAFLGGVALAIRRDSRADNWAMNAIILFKALPAFVLAIGLILLLSTTVFPILPAVSLLDPEVSPLLQPVYLVLPALTLILTVAPFLLRLVRSAMIETLEADYVAAARLRGIPERRIVWAHAVPNALVPVIQGIALTSRLLLGGGLIVEVVFSYPGIGNALNAAIEVRDVPVIQAITLTMAVGVVLINLLADVATVLVTPKLRTSSRPRLRNGTRAKLKLKAGGV